MTSLFFNSSSNNHSPYPSDHYEDHLSHHQFLSLNHQASSSSNSLTTRLFLNSNDPNEVFNRELQPQQQGDNIGSQPYNQKESEFSTWNKNEICSDINQVKWVSSKMRVMLKMKKSDHVTNTNSSSPTPKDIKKFDDHHKLPNSPIQETYNSSNSTSSHNSIPIRVCSDCNTTKTPLWRSGPRGPKSLCNACGIRQRKARRAMAAAENNNNNVVTDHSIMRPQKIIIKNKHKDHMIKKPLKPQVTNFKKNQYSKQITPITPPSSPSPSSSPSLSSSPGRKNCVEEYLVSFTKNLGFYHVFPQDEKEAAILLMALSCGYAHET